MDNANKKPNFWLKARLSDGTIHNIDMGYALRRLAGKELDDVQEIMLGIDRDGTSIQAAIEPNEADYPSITVNGNTDKNGRYWLGEFELPSEEYPDSITARLYAGCEKTETDAPIAMVMHDVSRTKQEPNENETYPIKIVHINYDEADSACWRKSGESENREHRNDKN